MSKLADAVRRCAKYLDALADNILENDADMRLDECRDPGEVAAELRAALAADEWQPIETAPIKPFGEVPSYYTFQAVIAHRVGERVCVSEGVFSYTRNGKHSWRTMFGVVKPTHWQPLPAPPQEKP